MNLIRLPEVVAVTLLTCAFASVARRNHTPTSRIWLTAWVMISIHFAASTLMSCSGLWGALATLVTLISLAMAGILFMFASVPYRNQTSSRWMQAALILTSLIYFVVFVVDPTAAWPLDVAASLFIVLPLGVTLFSFRRFTHPLRWMTVVLYFILAIFLLKFQHRPGIGPTLAVNGVLFTIYLACTIYFLAMYRRATTGAFITNIGFLAWASVFVVAPTIQGLMPDVQIESGLWNLPKYLVAVGMILLVLENQIEDNKYLALHDPLTGLPNRRLFEDRMTGALERSRRNGSQMALLVIDLDYFKEVNDTLGHHMGDLVLQRVASIFSERVRRSDTVSRTGGDEFSVILEEPTHRDEAENVGRSLCQLLESPLDLSGHKVQIGASVGIAIFPEDASEADSLCIAADRRMYEAKHYARRMNNDPRWSNRNSVSEKASVTKA